MKVKGKKVNISGHFKNSSFIINQGNAKLQSWIMQMVNSSASFKKVVKVPKNHEVVIHIPEEIPVNASIEVRVSVQITKKYDSATIIDEPIDSFLTEDEKDNVDEWTSLASNTFDS
jgi:hypothetical protein